MFVRRRHAVAALVAALLLTNGCGSPASPPASPMTTTTASPADSDAAAFAAAEETYRAYVEALNAVDLADPSTFEPVYALTTGEAETSLSSSLDDMRSEGWKVAGWSEIASLTPSGIDSARTQVTLTVCLDVSRVTVVDENGESVIGDRPDLQSLRVSASRSDDEWLLSKFESEAVPATC